MQPFDLHKSLSQAKLLSTEQLNGQNKFLLYPVFFISSCNQLEKNHFHWKKPSDSPTSINIVYDVPSQFKRKIIILKKKQLFPIQNSIIHYVLVSSIYYCLAFPTPKNSNYWVHQFPLLRESAGLRQIAPELDKSFVLSRIQAPDSIAWYQSFLGLFLSFILFCKWGILLHHH